MNPNRPDPLNLSGPASLRPVIIPEEEPLVLDGLAPHQTALAVGTGFTPLEIWQPTCLADKFLQKTLGVSLLVENGVRACKRGLKTTEP